MRRLALLLVPLFLVACDREPVAPDVDPTFAAATSEWTTTVVEFPAGDQFFYCAAVDDTFDEVGHVQERLHTVSTDEGFLLFFKWRGLDDFHLVAERTGDWYPATNGTSTYVERGSFTHDTYTFSFRAEPYIMVSENSGMKIRWPVRIHMTVNANGQVTVDHYAEPCQILGN